MKTNKKICILGGMGPQATYTWYKTLIELLQIKYGLVQDYEYPEMFIFNLNLSGWSERGIEDEKLVKKQLKSAIKRAELYHPSFIIIACNTVHYFFKYLQSITDIPIINLVGTCAEYIYEKGYKTVGILSSKSTNQLGVYQEHFHPFGIKCLTIDVKNQIKINKVILSVLNNNLSLEHKLILKEQIEMLYHRGAEVVILGCTELPLCINQLQVRVPILDAGYILLDKITDDLYENVPRIRL